MAGKQSNLIVLESVVGLWVLQKSFKQPRLEFVCMNSYLSIEAMTKRQSALDVYVRYSPASVKLLLVPQTAAGPQNRDQPTST